MMSRGELVIRVEVAILSFMSLNLYVRAVWIALVGQTLNPSVMIVAAPVALIAYLWVLQSVKLDQTQAGIDHQTESLKPRRTSNILLLLAVTSMGVGTYISSQAYEILTLFETDREALWRREVGMIVEGLSLILLWSSWTWKRYAVQQELAWRLHYPLSISIFTLPWEGILRGFDLSLQRMSTDLGVYCLDLLDQICEWKRPLKIAYWDSITIYSDHFYLIINETCAGVNLLISMSLYAIGFAWVMGTNIKRAWILILYILPLCVVFNGIRIALIFCLGHFGDQALATGVWHEGSAYVCQGSLFLVMALINHTIGRELMSSRHDPLR